MNIANQVQIIYIPWWVKTIVLLLLTGTLCVCVFLFYNALANGGPAEWIAAGTYLLAIVFPLLLIVVVVGGSSYGESSILKRTEKMLTTTVPYHLQFIPEEERTLRPFKGFRKSALTPEEQLAKIDLFHSKGRCYADYRVVTKVRDQKVQLDMRVELNVKRANVSVRFDMARLKAQSAAEGFDGTLVEFLLSKFSHSLNIEALQADEKASGADGAHSTIAYKFNKEFLPSQYDGRECLVVVATTGLPEDTVWNPSERVFFAQDLMFMIRSFITECPSVFAGEARADA